jgi:glycosyltransferase involved in cell wall biosynthesis
VKIMHVTNYFRDTHSHVGGAEQAAYRTALMAKEHGHSISVVTTKSDTGKGSEFDSHTLPIIEDYAPGSVRPYIEAAKWYSVQYDPLALRSFRRIVGWYSPDVAHFHNFQFLTLSLLKAAKDAQARTVVSIYDYWLFCPTVMLVTPEKGFCSRAHGPQCIDCLPPTFRSFQKALLSVRRKVIDHYMDMVDRFHVLSEHSRSVLEGYGVPRDRICVVPLTLPVEYRRAPVSDESVDSDMILFAGWLNERKGFHRLAEAMPAIMRDYSRVKLVAIGGEVRFGEAYMKMVNDTIDAGGFRDKITFTGHLDPDEVRKYIQKAAVVVIPEQYENMSPLLMIEAMSLGKPVVISRVGGVPEFIEDGVDGRLVDPLDPQDFAEKTVHVLQNPEWAREAGGRAREKILTLCGDEYIWEKTRLMYET